MTKPQYSKEQIDWLNSKFGIRHLVKHENMQTALMEAMNEFELRKLQAELIKLQNHIIDKHQRMILVFEGRDACGKKNMIRTFIEHMNPRNKRVVALSKPSNMERKQWYFQRYINHLPNPEEIALFNRSWYNRAVVEPVMGFCTKKEYKQFMKQVPEFEQMLYADNIKVVKFWLTITKEEQDKRFKNRLVDPLEKWKYTKVDESSQKLWDDYTEFVVKMLEQTNSKESPWVIVNTNDLQRGIREAIRYVLHTSDYDQKKERALKFKPDPNIVYQSDSPQTEILELLKGNEPVVAPLSIEKIEVKGDAPEKRISKRKIYPNELLSLNTQSELLDLLKSKKINYKAALSYLSYEDELEQLQEELGKMQKWVYNNKKRVVIIFEGRDAAGKGGSIKRFMKHMNPRSVRLVALPKPSDKEREQWYFQRYVRELPDAGEIVFFDRSWYNRAVVEPVNRFCTTKEYKQFLRQVPEFEHMLFEDDIILIKFWFSISKKEQKSRFESRKTDSLKQWKVSPVDMKAQKLWDVYTKYKEVMFDKTHNSFSPWITVQADSKKVARLETIRHVLSEIDYEGKDKAKVKLYSDPNIISRYYRGKEYK